MSSPSKLKWNTGVNHTDEVALSSSFRQYFARKIEVQAKQRCPLVAKQAIEEEEEKEKGLRYDKDEGCDGGRRDGDSDGDGNCGSESGILGVLSRLKRRFPSPPQSPASSSSSSSLSPSSRKRRKRKGGVRAATGLLSGIVAMCNGCVNPSNVQLEKLLNENGGRFVMGTIEFDCVTHVLCPNLSDAKARDIKKRRRHKNFVRPEWLVDSVNAKKILPVADYIVDELKPDKGCKGIREAFRGANPSPRKGQRGLPESSGAPQSAVAFQTSSPASRQLEGSVNGGDHASFAKSAPSPAITTTTASASASANANVTASSPLKSRKGPSTCGNDPNHLKSYWAHSRLSYIGRYQQRQKKKSFSKEASVANPNGCTYVFHIDMDYFFASVLLRDRPDLADKPVAVGHAQNTSTAHASSELSTCNLAARKLGVKKGMWLKGALEVCPNLTILQYDFDAFNEVADTLESVCDEFRDGAMELVSCDEGYIEVFLDDCSEGGAKARAPGRAGNAGRPNHDELLTQFSNQSMSQDDVIDDGVVDCNDGFVSSNNITDDKVRIMHNVHAAHAHAFAVRTTVTCLRKTISFQEKKISPRIPTFAKFSAPEVAQGTSRRHSPTHSRRNRLHGLHRRRPEQAAG